MSKEKNNIVIYQSKSGNIELHADVEKDTVWASQKSIAKIFDCSIDSVSLHLKNIFSDKELDEASVIEESSITGNDGKKYKVKHYNLDAIIAVGYRVNSKNATKFRIWATKTLREYIVEGYVINKHRLQSAPEKLIGLYDAVAFLESKSRNGKLRGKITLKLTEELEPSSN